MFQGLTVKERYTIMAYYIYFNKHSLQNISFVVLQKSMVNLAHDI